MASFIRTKIRDFCTKRMGGLELAISITHSTFIFSELMDPELLCDSTILIETICKF